MKKRSLLTPATGIVALALSVALAGCGSETKTTSSDTGTKTASSDSSAVPESASTSAAAPSAQAAATQPGPPGSPTVTLPALPGWSGDAATLKADPATIAAVHYDQTPDDAFVAVSLAAVDTADDALPAASAGANALNDQASCTFQGAVEEATISGFDGYKATQICKPTTINRVQQTRSIAVPNPGGTSYVVVITGTAKEDQVAALDAAMNLVDEQMTITP